MNMNRQTSWIVIAMILGIAVGYACNTSIGNAETLTTIAG